MSIAAGAKPITLQVPGIHCNGCVDSITTAMSRLAGVELVEADTSRKTITLAYDATQISLRQVEQMLEEAGFPAQPLPDRRSPESHSRRTVLLALGLAAVLATAGYLVGFQGFIYGVAMADAFGRMGLLFVGVIAGTAAFFSPCVFPLLPAYASYYLMSFDDSDQQAKRSELWRSMRWGGAAGLGVTIVNLGIGGLIVALGSAAPFEGDVRQERPAVLVIRFLAGLVIFVMGIGSLAGHGPGGLLLSRLGSKFRAGRRGGAGGFFVYGLTYNAAGLGCTGPILLSLMLYYALVSTQALAAFLTFTVTMGFLMLAVTVLVGLAQQSWLRRLRHATHAIQRVGAVTLVTLGAYTMLIQSFGAGREFFVRVFQRYLL